METEDRERLVAEIKAAAAMALANVDHLARRLQALAHAQGDQDAVRLSADCRQTVSAAHRALFLINFSKRRVKNGRQ